MVPNIDNKRGDAVLEQKFDILKVILFCTSKTEAPL